jgi:hypothetical protein
VENIKYLKTRVTNYNYRPFQEMVNRLNLAHAYYLSFQNTTSRLASKNLNIKLYAIPARTTVSHRKS